MFNKKLWSSYISLTMSNQDRSSNRTTKALLNNDHSSFMNSQVQENYFSILQTNKYYDQFSIKFYYLYHNLHLSLKFQQNLSYKGLIPPQVFKNLHPHQWFHVTGSLRLLWFWMREKFRHIRKISSHLTMNNKSIHKKLKTKTSTYITIILL